MAEVASKLFGTGITDDDVIGETLERATNPAMGLDGVKGALSARLRQPIGQWASVDDFRNDPLAVWTELTFGGIVTLPALRATRSSNRTSETLRFALIRETTNEAVSWNLNLSAGPPDVYGSSIFLKTHPSRSLARSP